MKRIHTMPFIPTLVLATLVSLATSSFSQADQPQPAPQSPQSAGLDAHSQKALMETQQLLTNQAARDAEIKKDPNAAKWDANAVQAVGSENKEDLYRVASEIMGDLVKQTNGDPKKMLELMDRAKSNPEAFFNSLSPEQKAKITDISRRAPAAQQQTQQPAVPK